MQATAPVGVHDFGCTGSIRGLHRELVNDPERGFVLVLVGVLNRDLQGEYTFTTVGFAGFQQVFQGFVEFTCGGAVVELVE